MIQIIEIPNIPLITPGDDIASIILNSIKNASLDLIDNDILLIAQSIISKSENRIVDLTTITPSKEALEISKQVKKDPRIIELILQESNKILKFNDNVIITETLNGLVCANAGIDQSNTGNLNHVTLLPIDADKSATEIRNKIRADTGKEIAIIITDTQGRPFRRGAINVGIGIAGFNDPIKVYQGKIDLYGYKLQTTMVNIIDELASAAELVMGESNEGYPVILIRGFQFKKGNTSSKELIRKREEDLFRDD
ncbi:MAG: coenzyme F420-0:L-glutamate ligase [Candidatus Helarchaeota archaeon]